jgi:hypothetical protein
MLSVFILSVIMLYVEAPINQDGHIVKNINQNDPTLDYITFYGYNSVCLYLLLSPLSNILG